MTSQTDRLNTALAGRYRIERHIGEGGMASVYLCEDLKHDRKVALKLLKPELAAVLGAERFVVEIKTTASLQHPHILPLFDSGTADGFLFYVMPYIEGETLRAKLDRETQLSVDDAVRIAREVLDALGYAHERGIVHRDVKPENILLHGGHAMVADFGIALAVSAAAGGRMTETGLSLGTPHYMSPEQATAEKEITARSDVYSLGSVLYEMLAGQPPHLGGSAQQIIMKIIAEPMPPVTSLRKSVPVNVAAAVQKSLEKLPADRFESAKAFGEALADPAYTNVAFNARVGGGAGGKSRIVTRPFIALAVVASALFVGALWGWLRPASVTPSTEQEIVLGSMGTAPGTVGRGTAIAPDGSAIAYTDTTPAGGLVLMLKERDRLAPRVLAPLTGLESRTVPAFSPDGRAIAFADGKLYRASRSGGPPIILSDSSVGEGVAWLDNGTIVSIATGGQALYATPSAGGPTRRVLTSDSVGNNLGGVSLIPGANAVLVTVHGSSSRALVLDLRTGATHVVQRGALRAWVVGGQLLFVGGNGALLTAPFDRRRLLVTGTPVTLIDSIQSNSYAQANPTGDIAIGADGTLLYVRRSPLAARAGLRLALVSLDGSARVLDSTETLPIADLGGLDLSPDGRQVAVSLTDSATNGSNIFVLNLGGGPSTRITFSGATNIRPAWSPDGKRIMYVSDALGRTLRLSEVPAGGGAPTLLTRIQGGYGGEWSPDQRWIIYRTDASATGNRDIFAVRTSGDSTPVALAATPAAELGPALSPDGHWLAYSSDRNGRQQVFVQPFPEARGAIWQVSSQSGFAPRWSHDGRRIFYQNGENQMLVADVRTSPAFSVVRTQLLFSGPYFVYEYYHEYSVMPDDRHFVMLQIPLAALGRGARVVEMTNWLPAALRGARD